jgi:hypothetical protein
MDDEIPMGLPVPRSYNPVIFIQPRKILGLILIFLSFVVGFYSLYIMGAMSRAGSTSSEALLCVTTPVIIFIVGFYFLVRPQPPPGTNYVNNQYKPPYSYYYPEHNYNLFYDRPDRMRSNNAQEKHMRKYNK